MQTEQVNFDHYAENYREIATKSVRGISGVDSNYFGEYKVKIIREHVCTKNKVHILDLGCGDGLNSVFFRKYFNEMEYFGIDISEKSIRQAQKMRKQNVTFQVYNGKKIPFKNDTFDIVLISCVLHHVPQNEHKNILKECKRVLKTNGSLFIFEHNPINPVTRKIVKDCVFDADAVLVKKNELTYLMKEISYSTIKTSYTIFFPRKGFFNQLIKIEKMLKWLPLGGQYYVIGKK